MHHIPNIARGCIGLVSRPGTQDHIHVYKLRPVLLFHKSTRLPHSNHKIRVSTTVFGHTKRLRSVDYIPNVQLGTVLSGNVQFSVYLLVTNRGALRNPMRGKVC